MMLPIMAAANRPNYTKVLRWLLDEYSHVPDQLLQQFSEGGFVVRTSQDSVYGCSHGDYIIETCLMEPLKGAQGRY